MALTTRALALAAASATALVASARWVESHDHAAATVYPPEQIKLSYGADCSQMHVYWATDNHTDTSSYVPAVLSGTSPALGTVVTGTSDTYTLFDILSPALHYTLLTGLTCNTPYYYRVGDQQRQALSPLLNFTTAHRAGDVAAYPQTFVAYADMGISNSQNTADAVTALVLEGQADFIVHAGDISYADDRIQYNNGTWYEGVLNQYYNEIQPYASLVPYMSSSGNHEAAGTDAEGKGFYAYRKRMAPTLPWQASGGSEFWYSVDIGRIHLLAFDIDQPYAVGTPQYEWITADLAKVDRTVTPWVVAFSHFPMRCSNYFWCLAKGGPAEFASLYEPIFNSPATKVDVFINGHVHAAEVMWPNVNGTVTQYSFEGIQQTLHCMVGFPGDMEVCCNDWAVPKPSYSFWRADDVAKDGGLFGFSRWTVHNDTHLTLQLVDAANRTAVLEQTVSRKFPF